MRRGSSIALVLPDPRPRGVRGVSRSRLRRRRRSGGHRLRRHLERHSRCRHARASTARPAIRTARPTACARFRSRHVSAPIPSCGVTSVTSVRVTPAKLAGIGALQAAIQGLAPGQCTDAGLRRAREAQRGTRTDQAGRRAREGARGGGRQADPDTLTLTCQPATPSFAAAVQPILTSAARRAPVTTRRSAPRSSISPRAPPTRRWSAGKATDPGVKLLLVAPRQHRQELRRAEDHRQGAQARQRRDHAAGLSRASRRRAAASTDAEIYTILAWIQSGAPNN